MLTPAVLILVIPQPFCPIACNFVSLPMLSIQHTGLIFYIGGRKGEPLSCPNGKLSLYADSGCHLHAALKCSEETYNAT